MMQCLKIDAGRQSLIISGKSIVLQAKTWQVLSILVDRAPEIVARAEIIDVVWRGRHVTGDKGLNQALWSIRAALGDDSRDPRYVRTVPRLGYQWIYPARTQPQFPPRTIRQKSPSRMPAIAASLIVLSAGLFLTSSSHSVGGAIKDSSSAPVVATKAFLRNKDIVVELASGCLGILKNESNKDIGEPVLSLDGSRVAFTLRENDSCRLVTVELSDGTRSDFGACPPDIT